MNPNTNTREEFTTALISTPIPPAASPEWKKLVVILKVLLDKLVHHPAMAPNLHQTYMTPAANKNKIYFMWDFVGRTLGQLYAFDPRPQGPSAVPANKAAWEEASGRAGHAGMLILDVEPGMLNQMTESTYPSQKGAHPEFGKEIVEIAMRLPQS